MKRVSISIFLLIYFTAESIFCSRCFASFENIGLSAQYQAMGGTAAAYVNSSDALFLNCSGLALVPAPHFSLYYSNPFGIKSISHGSLSGLVMHKSGFYGLAVETFGNSIYQENQYLLSYANTLNHRFYYGLSLRYLHLDIARYGSDAALGIDFGFITALSPKLHWGFYTHNMNRPKISSRNEAIPQIFCTGISFLPVDDARLNVDIFKDSKFPAELRFGFEYMLIERMALRSGFITDPACFTAGFGFMFSLMQVDYAFRTHNDLGNTHQFSVSIFLKKRKTKTKSRVKHQADLLKININTATVEQLQLLRGIGPRLAQRIVVYRQQYGQFENIEDLKDVKGIGDKMFSRIKDRLATE